MKKFVWKTIVITAVCIVVACVLLYGFIAIAFPKTLSKLYDGAGNEVKAVKYMDKAYRGTGDINDLVELSKLCIKTGDNGIIAQYLVKLFDDDSFLNYCEQKENGTDFYDFMASKYVVSLYYNGEKTKAIDTGVLLTKVYRKANPLYTLIRTIIAENTHDTDSLIIIKGLLTKYNDNEDYLPILNDDIALIEKYLEVIG